MVQQSESDENAKVDECLRKLAYWVRTATSKVDIGDLKQTLTDCREAIEPPLTDTQSDRFKLWRSVTRLRRLMLDQERGPGALAAARDELLRALETHRSGLPLDLAKVSAAYTHLKERGLEEQLCKSISHVADKPNLSIRVHSNLFDRSVVRRIDEPASVQSQLDGIALSGCGRALGTVKLRLQPCDTFAKFGLIADTNVAVKTRSSRGPATVFSDSCTSLVATRPLRLDENGLSFLGPTAVTARANVTPIRVETKRKLGSRLVSRIAYRKANELGPASRQLAVRESRKRIVPQFETESATRLSTFNQRYTTAMKTVEALRALPESLRFHTATDALCIQARYDGGLGVSTDRCPIISESND
ncbi:MAG: hypothetical protein AAFX06_17545, partial [Planctomycetota bacterium]